MFQSTHPRGVRQQSFNALRSMRKFQSTHPRGVRQTTVYAACTVLCFNPRTHAGCDNEPDYILFNEAGFNPRTHAGCDKMFDTKDENGKESQLSPDTLIVPTALRKKALEIVGSTGKSDTGDNNVNVYDGNLQVIVLDQFRRQSGKTGQPWAVIDSQAAKESLKWINRLESGDDYELLSWKDEATQVWSIGSIMWYSAGAYDWRPFQFSIPA